ncbi:ImmA/IrrE family metallo-endopeptidase [Listeria seeligeri]|uniref:ImmA/IrrE family metallo-endopeptidase n=1 Tax=Listeria seeligeri TaxID=1640 RepID=UPI0022EB87D9|nr:ImmA/IrrE family metallo-endopeptidase [Listeria seeligeri]
MNMTSDELKNEFSKLDFIIDKNLPKKFFAHIQNNIVHLNPDLTESQLKCTIVEEAMHYKYTAGDIVDLHSISDIKQEKFARRKAHEYLLSIETLVICYDSGYRTYYDVACFLNITESFLIEAVENYREKYGLMHYKGDFIVNFGSTIQIFQEDNSFYPYDYGC